MKRPRVICHMMGVGMASLFDLTDEKTAPHRLVLAGVERRVDDVLWLRYRVGGNEAAPSPAQQVEVARTSNTGA
jgi:hypothetical protein